MKNSIEFELSVIKDEAGFHHGHASSHLRCFHSLYFLPIAQYRWETINKQTPALFITVTSGSLARRRNHFAIDELHH